MNTSFNVKLRYGRIWKQISTGICQKSQHRGVNNLGNLRVNV